MVVSNALPLEAACPTSHSLLLSWGL